MSQPAAPAPSAPAPSAAPASPSRKWIVLTVVTLASFMATFDTGIVFVSAARLADSLNTTASTVVWVSVAYFLVSVALVQSLGWLGDTVGRKAMFIIGIVIFAVGLGLCSLADSIGQLILFRMVQAVGQAFMTANEYAIITLAFGARERGKAIGVNSMGTGLGLGLGPLFGGLVLDAAWLFGEETWRALFWTRIPLAALGVALAFWFIRADRAARRGPLNVDYAGVLTLMGASVGFLLAVNRAGRDGLTPLVIGAAAAAAVLLPLFIWRERRAANPVVDLRLFRNKVFTSAVGSHALQYLADGAWSFLAPFYLINGLGYSATAAGALMTTFPIIRVVVSPWAGWVSDKLGTRGPAMLGMAVMLTGLFLLALLGLRPPAWQILGCLILTGVGGALFVPVNTSAMMGHVPKERLGSASAFIATSRQIGRSSGSAIAGAVFAALLWASPAAPEFSAASARAFSWAIAATVFLCLAVFPIIWMRGKN